jgi:predicted nucleic acid-binding protein
MKLVVDANVVFSALVKKGVAFLVFLLNSLSKKFEFIAPEYLWIEIDNKKEKVLKYSRLSGKELEELTSFLKREIEIIPNSEFLEFIPKAESLLKCHEKDTPYLALALAFNCAIFSGDEKLESLSPVPVYSPRELLNILLGKNDLESFS